MSDNTNFTKKSEVTEVVIHNLIDMTGITEPIQLQQKVITDLGMDSLDIIETVMALEEEFEFEIPDEDYDQFSDMSVEQIIDYVCRRLSITQ